MPITAPVGGGRSRGVHREAHHAAVGAVHAPRKSLMRLPLRWKTEGQMPVDLAPLHGSSSDGMRHPVQW
jgi:hypothetical protein